MICLTENNCDNCEDDKSNSLLCFGMFGTCLFIGCLLCFLLIIIVILGLIPVWISFASSSGNSTKDEPIINNATRTSLTSLGFGNITQPNQDFSRLTPNGTLRTTTAASCNPGFSGFNCSIYNCSIDDVDSCKNTTIDCTSSITYNTCPQTCNFYCQQTTKRSRAPSILPDTNPTSTESTFSLISTLTSTYCNYVSCGINQIFNQSTCSCNYNCSIQDPYIPCLISPVDCRNSTIREICLGTCANCTKLNFTTTAISVSNFTTTINYNSIPTLTTRTISPLLTSSTTILATNNKSSTSTILNSLTSTNLLNSSTTIFATTTTTLLTTTSCNNFIICSIVEEFDLTTCSCQCSFGFSGPDCTYNCSIPDPFPSACSSIDCSVPSSILLCPNKCSNC